MFTFYIIPIRNKLLKLSCLVGKDPFTSHRRYHFNDVIMIAMTSQITTIPGPVGLRYIIVPDHIPRRNKLLKLSSWWRHQMETLSALLAICAGNSPVPGEFLAQRPVTWSWWFETLPRPLWRHCNVFGWQGSVYLTPSISWLLVIIWVHKESGPWFNIKI